ncbi:dihydrouridine synthase 4-like protein [Pseudomassariella vexata]|uniref:Dihydrouridine synthase 4-like protein n=1 Tax=Pseudomassariella vexata TaxID=1141098 RepID=A0A1Y2DEH1_9PEZI|nr:dihydrouridine synthase 4-like protein [Pseudomassariella vexata]ORY57526.1 dihydrouridine synthase 4-like protein [Pseudomassariella vexata]
MTTDHEDGDINPFLPTVHPLKIFDAAKSQGRFLYACAPMVRYSKLAFRQTVYHYGTDLCWTPMVLAKEFNRNQVARDSDLTISSSGPQPHTIVQFGSNSPTELSHASSLAAPWVSGVDLNCGCPQSWACAETLGAALMEKRELVRDMVVETRSRLEADGWDVGKEKHVDSLKGRSVSVKIRVHKDLRKTMDFITTVIGNPHNRNVDWLTIHPRTRSTPSTSPINLEALSILTEKFGPQLPILVSGDVFTLATLPYTSHLLDSLPIFTSKAADTTPSTKPYIPKLAGLMSARALLANPALFAGHETCPWEAVDVFLNKVARAPLPLKLAVHHINEMCGPGYGPDKRALLSKKERMKLNECGSWIDVLDYLDEVRKEKDGGGNGMRRYA